METNQTFPNANHGDWQDLVTTLYAKAKELYKRGGDKIQLLDAANELSDIQKQFHAKSIKKGEVFCLKGLAIIYRKMTIVTEDLGDKLSLLEASNDFISDALLLAASIGYTEPSLQKHQTIIKSALAEVLHLTGDHRNANQLETTVFKTISKTLQQYPDYPEMYLELATTSYRKIKWSLNKILLDLGRAENLLQRPQHTKHRPDTQELEEYESRITRLRESINQLLTNARFEPGIL